MFENPIFYSIRVNNISMFNMLLKFGADINAKTMSDNNILLCSIKSHNYDCINFCLNSGFNPTCKYKNGITPIIYAIDYYNPRCFSLIINSSYVKYSDKSRIVLKLLTHAIMNNNRDCLESLISAGANVQVTDDLGRSLLYIAHKYRATDCFKTLVRKGVKMNLYEILNVNSLSTIVRIFGKVTFSKL
jgi:ankyrin repeat protein